MMFMGLLSVILFVLVVAIFKNVVEGRDVKFELTVELVLIVIYVIYIRLYLIEKVILSHLRLPF